MTAEKIVDEDLGRPKTAAGTIPGLAVTALAEVAEALGRWHSGRI